MFAVVLSDPRCPTRGRIPFEHSLCCLNRQKLAVAQPREPTVGLDVRAQWGVYVLTVPRKSAREVLKRCEVLTREVLTALHYKNTAEVARGGSPPFGHGAFSPAKGCHLEASVVCCFQDDVREI